MRGITLYIPCYNAERYISRCLDGVVKQTLRPDEVLLIDDGSTDGTVAIASRYPVTVVRQGSNLGLAAARNAAVMKASGDLVASLDSDCVPSPDWLERLEADVRVEGVAGAGGMLVDGESGKLVDRWRAVYMRQNWGRSRITNPRFLFGSNNIFRKAALVGVGLYDPKYRTNNEDCDLSLRLRAAGHTLIYDPSATVCHIREDTFGSLMDTHWRWTFSGVTGKRRPDNIYDVMCKLYDGTAYLFRDMLWNDIKNGRPDFLPIDLASFFHHVFRDIGFYVRSKMARLASLRGPKGRSNLTS